MLWARMLAYLSGTVDQELLLRNEYLAAANRILRAQVQGRLLLSDAGKASLAEIAYRLGRKTLEGLAAAAKPLLRRGACSIHLRIIPKPLGRDRCRVAIDRSFNSRRCVVFPPIHLYDDQRSRDSSANGNTDASNPGEKHRGATV